MLSQKSYTLYNSFLTRPYKIRLKPNKTFFFDRSNLFQSNSNSNSINYNFPAIKIPNNNKPHLKRAKSFKKSIDYKFYKLLKKGPITPKQKKGAFYYPEIIDKSPFSFNLQDEEDETLKRIKKINKGNKKHRILSNIAYKKEIQKRKNTKKFLNEMKLTKINIRLLKKKVIEEKKIMNEFNSMNFTHTKKIIKLKNIVFDSPKTTKNIYDINPGGEILSFNKLFDNERKLIIKKGRLMHRFHEIMNKINSKNDN